ADTFTRVRDGRLAVDPTIDVVVSLGLTRERILARMPYNLRTLSHVLKKSAPDFRVMLRSASATARARSRRVLWRGLRKARKPLEELSPRTEMLERWADELREKAAAVV